MRNYNSKLIKKIRTIILGTLITVNITTPFITEASEDFSDTTYVDGSYLTEEDESSVVIYPRTRGVYLLEGAGAITRPFTGIAGCIGSTTATKTVSRIAINVVLQRYEDGKWYGVEAWNEYTYNDFYISIYEVMEVEGGYYYRVETTHTAYTDVTMGATNGVWFS